MLGKQPGGEGKIDTILGESARFKGDIQVEGGIRVDGEFDGSLRCNESVVVGKTGIVRADIQSDYVTVGGKVFGNVIGRRKVILEAGAHVEGDVTTSSLVINEGVFFQGGCRMGDGAPRSEWDTETTEYAKTSMPGETSRDPKAETKTPATVRSLGGS